MIFTVLSVSAFLVYRNISRGGNYQQVVEKNFLLLLIPQSFDWLAAFHLELLQAIFFIAV